jgi:putative membrane protein
MQSNRGMELAPVAAPTQRAFPARMETCMKTLQSFLGRAAIGLAIVACGAVMAQTPTNGSSTQQPPQTAGPAPAATPGATSQPGFAAQPGSAAPEASAHTGNGLASGDTSGAGATMGQTSRKSAQSFITKAARANRSEIDEARYALDHSSNDQVKQFAQRMIDDHTKALDQLKQIASSDGYDMPSGMKESSADRMEMSHLKHDQGAKFDTAYSRHEVREHRAVIAEFKQAEQNMSLDPAVRRYARETLPTLTEHLRLAQHLVATAGKGNRSAG